MKKISLVMLSGLMVMVAACNEKEQVIDQVKKVEVPAVEAPAVDLSTDKAKFSYAIGYQFARTLKDNDLLKDVDIEAAILAIQETVNDGKEASMTEEQVVEAITAFQTRIQEQATAEAEASGAADEAAPEAAEDDDVVDAEFSEVDEDKKG